MKRKQEDVEPSQQSKTLKTDKNGVLYRQTTPTSRFQLSSKSTTGQTSVLAPSKTAAHTDQAKSMQKQLPKQESSKKGFTAILDKARQAQEAGKERNMVGGITHKPVEKLSRRERERLREEARIQQKRGKKGYPLPGSDRSRSGTPSGTTKEASLQKKSVPDTLSKGIMKKAHEPLSYKGTMRVAGTAKNAPKRGQPQDKYGGYASWSDLDDAEDQEEGEAYDSDDSEDMEGGFDDLEAEENAALRLAKKEDQEALEEEQRLKQEKLERKRKLEALALSKSAKKKF